MMLARLKYFWILSMTDAGSVFSICPSKTNNWVRRTNRIKCQEVDGRLCESSERKTIFKMETVQHVPGLFFLLPQWFPEKYELNAAADRYHQMPRKLDWSEISNIVICSFPAYCPSLCAWTHSWYLAGVVIVEPALQVDGVPAWHQTAVLEDPQFDWSVVARGDDVMEGVFQRHRVIVGSLVLRADGEVRRMSLNKFLAALLCSCRDEQISSWCEIPHF